MTCFIFTVADHVPQQVILYRKEGKPQGWVRYADVTVGHQRRFGDTYWDIRFPDPSHSIGPRSMGWGKMEKVMADILIALDNLCKTKPTEIQDFLPEWLPEMIDSRAKIHALIDDLHYGTIRAGMQAVLNQDDLTITQLRDAGRGLTRGEHYTGIYCIVYWDWKDDPSGQRKPEFYIGQSDGMVVRYDKHVEGKDDPRIMHIAHYRSARQANKMKMFPLYLTSNCDRNKLTTFEQLFIVGEQSYHPFITSLIRRGIEDPDLPTADRVNEHQLFFQQMAGFLMNIAQPVFALHDWNSGFWCRSFGAGKGLNWSSPFMEDRFGVRALYLRVTVPTVLKSYRRQPFLVSQLELYKNQEQKKGSSVQKYKKYGSISVKHLNADGTVNYSDYVNFLDNTDAEGPKVGQECQLVFEVMERGLRHSVPWCRIPDHFPYEKRWEALALGIRVEWREDDVWKTKYLQSTHMQNYARDSVVTTRRNEVQYFSAYHNAMGILRYLKGEKLTQSLPQNKDFGIARIQDLHFNDLNQTFTITNFQQPRNRVTDHVISRPRMENELPTLNGVFQIGGSLPHGLGKRTTCDRCYCLVSLIYKEMETPANLANLQ